MATYRRRGATWRAELYRDGHRESNSFPTKQQAVAWAIQREAELVGARLPDKSVGDALRRYATDVSPRKRGHHWEDLRLSAIGRDKLAAVMLPSLKPIHLAEWRGRRLAEVSAATVRREMNLLQSVLKACRRDWGWLASDPIKDIDRPTAPLGAWAAEIFRAAKPPAWPIFPPILGL